MLKKSYPILTLFALITTLLPLGVFANGIRKAGDIGQHLIPASALVCSLAINDQEGVHQFGKMGVITIGTVYALKFSINRKRPKGGDLSFPSGHTASAFWGATYLHRRYGLACGIPAYLAASFVGYSRVRARKHFTSDVIAGAAIAFIASRYLVTPFINKDSMGITFENSF